MMAGNELTQTSAEARWISRDRVDATGDESRCEASVKQGAYLHVVAVTNQGLAVGEEREAVTASEHCQWAQRVEARSEPGHAVPAGDEVVLECLAGALGQLIEVIARIAKLTHAGQSQAVGESVEVQGDFASVGHAEFAGFAGGKRTSVGGQVGEGHVDFVANSRDDRQA
jgi:hypothetical protein